MKHEIKITMTKQTYFSLPPPSSAIFCFSLIVLFLFIQCLFFSASCMSAPTTLEESRSVSFKKKPEFYLSTPYETNSKLNLDLDLLSNQIKKNTNPSPLFKKANENPTKYNSPESGGIFDLPTNIRVFRCHPRTRHTPDYLANKLTSSEKITLNPEDLLLETLDCGFIETTIPFSF